LLLLIYEVDALAELLTCHGQTAGDEEQPMIGGGAQAPAQRVEGV
jgi:hypothetical protein